MSTAERVWWRRGDHCLISPTGRWRDWVAATVTRVDEQGVHVQLVRKVSEERFACANPGELVPIPPRYEPGTRYGAVPQEPR